MALEETKITRDDLYNMVKEMVSDAGKEKIEVAKELADKTASDTAQGIISSQHTTPEDNTKSTRKKRTGQFVRALAFAKGDKDKAINFVKGLRGGGDPTVVKALMESTFDAGGALIETQFSDDVIELLSERTVVRKMGVESVPMEGGNMTMPYIGAGAVAQYTGENQPVTAQTMEFGQLELRSKELVALVPISNKLLRHTNRKADQIVGNDLVRALSVAENSAFLRGAGSQASPKGFLYWSQNKFDATQTGANPTVAEVTEDLGNAIFLLEDSDIDIMNGNWAFNPIVKKGLMTARDANSNLVWEPEMRNGTLMGFPFHYTTAIPRNLGAGTESEIYFVDADTIVIGEDEQIRIEMFNGAAYVDATGNVVSAVSQNMTVMRAVAMHDLGARQRGKEISIIEAAKWGQIVS